MHQVLINDIDIKQAFNISVMKIRGVFDMPGRFGTYERDWQDVDGIEAFVELSDLYYKQRRITLECVMEAYDIGSLQYLLGIFRTHVYDKFTLATPYSTHECILKDGAKVKLSANKYETGIIAEFSLTCNEISYSFGTTFEPDINITNDVFSLNKISLSRFGIIVEESEGFFDFTTMKDDNITRYMRESDVVNKRKSRDIRLKCSLCADNTSDFQSKMNSFHALLSQPDLLELMLPMPGLEKAYLVFCANGFTLSELYLSTNSVVGRFDLILREAEPMPETFFLTILLDTDGNPILTEDGKYIYIIADRIDTGNSNTYLYTPDELQDDIYLFTTNELDINNPDYDSESEERYLFLNEEL